MPLTSPVQKGRRVPRPLSQVTPTKTDILSEVLRLRVLGLCLIPIAEGKKSPPKGFNRRRRHKERPRRRELECWFKKHKNVAMVTGPVSGHVCGRDFEDRDSFFDWAASHPDLAQKLPTIRTSRGFCVLFRTDGKDPALAGKAEHKQRDGELKVHSSLITLPPSHHPSGCVYKWEIEPFHTGFPLVSDVVAAGLLSPLSQTGSDGARARPMHPASTGQNSAKNEAHQLRLFGRDGSLDREAFDAVIGGTIPDGPGQREACLWRVARILRSLEETRRLPVNKLEPVIDLWWTLARSAVRTKDWMDTWAAFSRAWDRVRKPIGEGGDMQEIVQVARRNGVPLGLDSKYTNDIGWLVAAICRELSRRSADGVFFLHTETLSRLIGVSISKSAACLRALQASSIIRRVVEPRAGRASEYVYLLPTE